MKIDEKEGRELDELDLQKEKAITRAEIAAAKKMEREYRREYGPNWRKILGVAVEKVKELNMNKGQARWLMGRRDQ